MPRSWVRRKSAVVIRWLVTVTALACLLIYVFGGGWRLELRRDYLCTGAGVRASGANFCVGLSCGSAMLDVENDQVLRKLLGAPGRFFQTTTVYEWRWYCTVSPRRTADLLPSVSRETGLYVLAPLWIPAIVLGTSAGLLWRGYFQSRGPSRCRDCGYDHAGLAADAKCPECGTVPARG